MSNGKRGRPSIYTPQLAARICERLAAGESLRSICRDEDMPDEHTVRNWAWQNAEFSPQYAQARDIGLDVMADDVLDISDDGRNDWMKREEPENPGYDFNGEHVQRSKLRVETRKWYLAKLASKRYGDRLAVEHSGSVDIATRIVESRKRAGSSE